jgi:hypothetical protein
MATYGHVKLCAIAAVVLLSSQSGMGWAQAVTTTQHDTPGQLFAPGQSTRDGQHDFDFTLRAMEGAFETQSDRNRPLDGV